MINNHKKINVIARSTNKPTVIAREERPRQSSDYDVIPNRLPRRGAPRNDEITGRIQ